MIELYLLLGGNLGDKQQIFDAAKRRLSEDLGELVQTSAIYETEPWGFDCDDMFWNQVLLIKTKLSAQEVLAHTKAIEIELGRKRGDARYASRTIDIDLLFYGNLVLQEEHLELPHPRMINRRFVLEPLNEIAPELVHPVFNKTTSELLNQCEDKLQAKVLA